MEIEVVNSGAQQKMNPELVEEFWISSRLELFVCIDFWRRVLWLRERKGDKDKTTGERNGTRGDNYGAIN
jgi:hypothetical protein